jgi:allantoinase
MSTALLAFRARRAAVDVGGAPQMRSATVFVEAGVVARIDAYDAELGDARLVDVADDAVLLPGLVDTHVHVNEPGRTEWEGFASATRAAAAGGVTTILDMPLNSVPPTTTPDALDQKRRAADGKCSVDVGFWGGAVPENLGSLGELLAAGTYGVKCFLVESGVPEFGHLDADGLDITMSELADVDGLLLVHAEDPALLAAAPDATGRSYAGFLASRPPEAELAAIERVVESARLTGGRVHLVHLSCADALPLLASARADGVRITVETCPHYLTLTAEDIPDGATDHKCCPPIRSDDNRDRLWQGLADGVIDLVVTDHSPSTVALKGLDTGDFAQAWGGIASLQLGLPLVWTEARRRGHPLQDVVRWMATAPARMARVDGKGAIAVGNAADLVVLADDDELVVDPAALHHRNPVTPYAGRTLTGVVRQTWLAGEPVGDEPRGRLLAPAHRRSTVG